MSIRLTCTSFSANDATADLIVIPASAERMAVEETQAILAGLEGAARNPSLAQVEQVAPYLLLAELIRRAGSADVRQICAVAQVARYGGPRGELGLRDAHVEQRIYLARAAGLEFDIVSTL